MKQILMLSQKFSLINVSKRDGTKGAVSNERKRGER